MSIPNIPPARAERRILAIMSRSIARTLFPSRTVSELLHHCAIMNLPLTYICAIPGEKGSLLVAFFFAMPHAGAKFSESSCTALAVRINVDLVRSRALLLLPRREK
jgi:hypothetical protein